MSQLEAYQYIKRAERQGKISKLDGRRRQGAAVSRRLLRLAVLVAAIVATWAATRAYDQRRFDWAVAQCNRNTVEAINAAQRARAEQAHAEWVADSVEGAQW